MMRGYGQLTRMLLKSLLREPVGFFFLIIFSPALFLLLGMIFGNTAVPEFGGHGFIDNMVPGIVIMSILIVGTSVIPQNQLGLRTSGAFTRLRMTPLKPSTYVAADMTVNAAVGMIGPILTIALSMLVFDVEAPQHWFSLIAVLVLGMVAMLGLGYALAMIFPSLAAATGFGNMLMILLMLTSGAFVPVAALAEQVQRAFEFSPSYHFARLVSQAWQGESLSASSALVLVGVAVGFSALALVLTRRR